MPGTRASFSALAVAACATALAACGGNDEGGTIPQDAGDQLIAQLSQIEEQVELGDCEAARSTAVAFADGVSRLPDEVGGELRDGLVEASSKLVTLTEDPEQCAETGASGETGALPTETDDTTAPPEETTDTPAAPADEEEEPSDEDDGEGASGNGTPGGSQGNQGGGQGNQGGSDDSSGGIGSDG